MGLMNDQNTGLQSHIGLPEFRFKNHKIPTQALIQKWAAENNVDFNSDMKMATAPVCVEFQKFLEVGIRNHH